jgi:hypothetical protein
VRARGGTIETIDAPGAGKSAGQGTIAYGLNSEGEIAGYYFDASTVTHGFLRAHDGTFVTFDVAGGGTGIYQGTFTSGINGEGAIAGLTSDSNYASHGFLRAPGGAITTFDVPGAGAGGGQGTFPTAGNGLNSEGTVAGWYVDASYVNHAFLRAPDGEIATFDAPGAGTGSGQGTLGFGLSSRGAITGPYVDASNVAHGFLRARDGTLTTFDVPGAGTGAGTPGCVLTIPPSCQGTIPENVNSQGAITGEYVDANGVNHGFVRARGGAITSFDVPGAGTGVGQGTIPLQNNRAGAITGSYIDANGVIHGFLRTGRPCGDEGGGENCERN